MSTTIEGLKVTVTGAELSQLCAARSKFHRERAAVYKSQKEALPDLDESSPIPSSSNKAPQEMIQERITQHENDASELDFISAHLEPASNYHLERHDLQRLGIAKSTRF